MGGSPALRPGPGGQIAWTLLLLPGLAMPFFLFKAVQTLRLSFLPPYVFMKDVVQDWLMAKALMAGIYPYAPLPELAARFLGPFSEFVILRHPSPHPPPAALLALPLGLLTCQQATFVWFAFELACIGASVYLVLQWWQAGRPAPSWAIGLTVVLIAWAPFWEGLMVGQINPLILLLLICAWRTDRQAWRGLFLGFSLALKFMGWPIWLFLLARRQWRAAGTALAVVLATHAAAVLVMGTGPVRHYYGKIAGSVDAVYRFADGNFSVWSLGWRIFAGTSGPFRQSIDILPLVSNDAMALPASLLFLCILVAAGVALALRCRNRDAAWALLFCLSAVVGPTTWIHYLVLLFPPAAVALRNVAQSGFPLWRTAVLSLLLFLLLIPDAVLTGLAAFFNTNLSDIGPVTVPFAAGLLTLVPLAVTLGLMALVYASGKAEAVEAPSSCNACQRPRRHAAVAPEAEHRGG